MQVKKTWGEIKEKARKENKRFAVVQLTERSWSVEDCSIRGTTKAIFYDEASEELAKEFCRQINEADKKANKE